MADLTRLAGMQSNQEKALNVPQCTEVVLSVRIEGYAHAVKLSPMELNNAEHPEHLLLSALMYSVRAIQQSTSRVKR